MNPADFGIAPTDHAGQLAFHKQRIIDKLNRKWVRIYATLTILSFAGVFATASFLPSHPLHDFFLVLFSTLAGVQISRIGRLRHELQTSKERYTRTSVQQIDATTKGQRAYGNA